jgi:hypothetical protein
MHARHVVPLFVVLTVAGCRDFDTFEVKRDPSFAVSSAQTGGNPRFHFHPPLREVLNPKAPFDANHLEMLEVQICKWKYANASEPTATPSFGAGHCADGVKNWTFTGESGPHGHLITLDNQRYDLDWNTGLFGLTATRTARDTVRIIVRSGGTMLGFIDAVAGVNSSNLKDVSTAHFYPFVNGSSVPIKMRVEEGAFCPDPEAPCTTVVLNTEEEQEIYSADEHLWILFTEDAAEKLGEARRLDIQRIGRQCLPTSFQEYEACYSVTLTPSLEEVPLRTDEEEFEIDEVVLAICFDPRATHDHIWVHSADDMDPGTLGPPWPNRDHITPLAISGHSRPPGFCDGFTLLSQASGLRGAFARAASRVLGPALAAVLVQPLYARTGHLTFSSRSFSRFAWVRTLLLKVGGTVVAAPGSTAELSATVATDQPWPGGHDDEPVPAVLVRFRVVNSGGAQVHQGEAMSGPDGVAKVSWNTGATPSGTYTVHVTTPHDGADPGQFTLIIGTLLRHSIFFAPVGTSDVAPPSAHGSDWTSTPRLQVCLHDGAGGCSGAPVLDVNVTNIVYDGSTPLHYQLNWRTSGLVTDAWYLFRVLVNGTPLPGHEVRQAGPTGNISGNVPVKFRIDWILE